MPLVSDRCVCLRKVEYSETSQILTIFGRAHGMIRVIARGAHRKTKAGASKFGGGIDLLDIADAVFTLQPERDLATLTEWSLREGHPELRRTLRGLYLGFYAAELVSYLIEEHDPHADLFDRLEQTLHSLATPAGEQAFLAFQLDLLRETGYLPELFTCVSCGREAGERQRASLSAERGGVLCGNCESAFPARTTIDGRLLGLMQYVLRLSDSSGGKLPILTRHQTDPINRVLAEHIQHTLGRRLRLPQYVVARRQPSR